MKGLTKFHTYSAPRLLAALIAAVLSPILILQGEAQIYTLQDNNSQASISPNSSAGMYSWQVLNQPGNYQNQLAQQWFWFRLGGVGGEAPINSIGPAVVTTSGASALTATYLDAAGRFNLNIRYSLAGGSLSSGVSDISEQITINNLTANPLDFHFFQYSDFDLGGSAGGDSLVLSRNPFTGLFNQADQVRGGVAFSETVVTPGANHAEAGPFPGTLNSLNDANPTTLSDNSSFGPGDATWAFEWDLNLAAGGSQIINKGKHLQVQFVPEPSPLWLISLGLIAFGWCRCSRRV